MRKRDHSFEGRKLDPVLYVHYLHSARYLQAIVGNEFKRATFYFPKGDQETIADHLMMPKLNTPSLIRDLHFKFCGERIKGAAAYAEWVDTKVPSKWQHRVSKSEKGIDIEICCDALRLVSVAKLDRLFLLTNDADFVPLCRTLRELGTNVSLLSLSQFLAPNKALLAEVDSYDVVPVDALGTIFVPLPNS